MAAAGAGLFRQVSHATADSVVLCYNSDMTKLLERAIEKVRELSEAEQDALATLLITESENAPIELDGETRAAILEGLEQARRGEFVPNEEMEALCKRHGL